MKRLLSLLLMAPVCFFMAACGDDDGDKIDPHTLDAGSKTEVDEDSGVRVAKWPYDTVQFRIGDAKDTVSVKLNGTPVQDFTGHTSHGDAFSAEGIAFSVLFEKVGLDLSLYGEQAMNCVARDHFDPLRTLLACDASKAPTVSFFNQYAFIYNCTGKKEEGTAMDGKALCVNYNLADESQIPANIGNQWTDISKQFWSKVETVDDDSLGISHSGHGVIEIGPDLENDPKCQQPTAG